MDFNSLVNDSLKIKDTLALIPKDQNEIKSMMVQLTGPSKVAGSLFKGEFIKIRESSGFESFFRNAQALAIKIAKNSDLFNFDYEKNSFTVVSKNHGKVLKEIKSVEKILADIGITEKTHGYWLLISLCFRPEVFNILQLSQFPELA